MYQFIYYPLGKITCRGCHGDIPKRRPMDVLIGSLCNAKGSPLPTSWERPLPTSIGPWNMTSWGRPHTVLYVTPWDVPYRRLEDASCRHYEHVPIQSNVFSPRNVSYRRPEDVLQTSLYGSISKAKKLPRDQDFCIWS